MGFLMPSVSCIGNPWYRWGGGVMMKAVVTAVMIVAVDGRLAAETYHVRLKELVGIYDRLRNIISASQHS